MRKSMKPVTFSEVRAAGLKLPGAEASTAYGSPALKVNGALFAVMAVHRSAEPGTLAVRVSLDQRDELLAEAPDIYYLTDHYVDYPFVLVRLSRVRLDAVEDLLRAAHRFAAMDKRSSRVARRRSRSRRH